MKPILYQAEVNIRFSDFDSYGHVNAGKYLDYVLNSRWDYCINKFKMGAADFVNRGIGFYLINFNINFMNAINLKTTKVNASSHVIGEVGKLIDVNFKIEDVLQTIVHSEGTLKFGIIDLKTNKLVTLPEQFRGYFWE